MPQRLQFSPNRVANTVSELETEAGARVAGASRSSHNPGTQPFRFDKALMAKLVGDTPGIIQHTQHGTDRGGTNRYGACLFFTVVIVARQ